MLNKLKILLKHFWLDADDTRRAIPPEMLARLTQGVAASELRHSGEIRICVESSLPHSYLWRLDKNTSLQALMRQRAVTLFGKLRVWDTAHNNGVLIYVLLAEKAIEIVADRGLDAHVSPAEWQAMVARMAGAFKNARYEEGLQQALEETSRVLTKYFAVTGEADITSNLNELPDAPVLQ